MPPPTRIPTPYGGRLTWKLPGGNNLIVHLKDKNKIRHRKRWSQVHDVTNYRIVIVKYCLSFLLCHDCVVCLLSSEFCWAHNEIIATRYLVKIHCIFVMLRSQMLFFSVKNSKERTRTQTSMSPILQSNMPNASLELS